MQVLLNVIGMHMDVYTCNMHAVSQVGDCQFQGANVSSKVAMLNFMLWPNSAHCQTQTLQS